jgi:hypothetical protein
MASAALTAQPKPAEEIARRSWRLLVLARASVDGGVTRADLARDLGLMSAHRLTPGELRAVLDTVVKSTVAQGLAIDTRNRLTLTETGTAAAHAALGLRLSNRPARSNWSDVRDQRLIAVALGIENEAASKLKLLMRPDGLRAAVLQKAYNLPTRSRASPARLRAELAVCALHRAFGNTIKGALDAGEGLSAKAGRLLAGQLAQKPRDFGTDARLITALAAEAIGSPQTDADALRATILRKFVGELMPPAPTSIATATLVSSDSTAPVRASPPVQADVKAASVVQPNARPAAANRPDLAGFAKVVKTIACDRAEGWPGNRKAYISDVWLALRTSQPAWGLTEIEFKGMLAEAHRTGHVVLANADLKDRRSLPRIQQSAIAFKNTVLHFVRVED